jgi:hypothetical protein
MPPLLDVAVQTIIDRAVELLNSRRSVGQGLAGVKKVVRGDEVGGDLRDLTPSIWVHGVIAIADSDRHTMVQEGVTMNLVITAITKARRPEAGSRLSQQLAARALYELRHDVNGGYDPTMGLEFVDNVALRRYELSTGEARNGLYGSALQPEVKFRASRTN